MIENCMSDTDDIIPIITKLRCYDHSQVSRLHKMVVSYNVGPVKSWVQYYLLHCMEISLFSFHIRIKEAFSNKKNIYLI